MVAVGVVCKTKLDKLNVVKKKRQFFFLKKIPFHKNYETGFFRFYPLKYFKDDKWHPNNFSFQKYKLGFLQMDKAILLVDF